MFQGCADDEHARKAAGMLSGFRCSSHPLDIREVSVDTGNELDFDLLARDIDAALGFDLCKSSAHKMTTPGRVHRIAACSTAGLLTLGLPKRPRTDATQNCPDVLFGVGILRPRHVGRQLLQGVPAHPRHERLRLFDHARGERYMQGAAAAACSLPGRVA